MSINPQDPSGPKPENYSEFEPTTEGLVDFFREAVRAKCDDAQIPAELHFIDAELDLKASDDTRLSFIHDRGERKIRDARFSVQISGPDEVSSHYSVAMDHDGKPLEQFSNDKIERIASLLRDKDFETTLAIPRFYLS